MVHCDDECPLLPVWSKNGDFTARSIFCVSSDMFNSMLQCENRQSVSPLSKSSVLISHYACADSAAVNEITIFSCCSVDSTSCLIRLIRDSVLLRLNISIFSLLDCCSVFDCFLVVYFFCCD